LNYTENHFFAIAISSHLPGVQKYTSNTINSTQLKTFTPVHNMDTRKQIAVIATAKISKLIHIRYIHIDVYF